MPRVLTILNCGTGFDRMKSDIVGQLQAMIDGQQFEDWMITDGVASGQSGYEADLSKPMEPGRAYGMARELQPLTTKDTSSGVVRDGKLRHVTWGSANLGLSATGMEDNVASAYQWVEQHVLMAQLGKGVAPSVLNMVGWSRGAFTCFRIAQEICNAKCPDNLYLSRALRGMSVNIFACDPVPGNARGADRHYYDRKAFGMLPANVMRYWVVVAENEDRPGMKLMIPEWKNGRGRIFRMPGVHNTMVNAQSYGSEVAAITMSLAVRLLTECGTPMKAAPKPDVELFRLYGMILQKLRAYRTGGLHSGQAAADFLFNGFQAVTRVSDIARADGGQDWSWQVRGAIDKLFVNDHHLELFLRFCPAFVNAARMNGCLGNEDMLLLERTCKANYDGMVAIGIPPAVHVTRIPAQAAAPPLRRAG